MDLDDPAVPSHQFGQSLKISHLQSEKQNLRLKCQTLHLFSTLMEIVDHFEDITGSEPQPVIMQLCEHIKILVAKGLFLTKGLLEVMMSQISERKLVGAPYGAVREMLTIVGAVLSTCRVS